MKAWLEKIAPAQSGDVDAFDVIVCEFQDMAVGYAYSLLRDFDLAEDAAQDAFIEAFRDLSKLREPRAFPGWFRRIVFKRCDRILRTRATKAVGLEHAESVPSGDPTPAEAAERGEVCDRVMAAIASLPESERTAVTLFYINGYSHAEVGEFLDQTVSAIKSRLHSARGRLRERMKDMADEEMDKVRERLKSRKPGKEFSVNVFKEIPLDRWWDPTPGTHPRPSDSYWMEGPELVCEHQGEPPDGPAFGLQLGGPSWDDYRVSLEYMIEKPGGPRGANIQFGPRGHGIFCVLESDRVGGATPRENSGGGMQAFGWPPESEEMSLLHVAHWNNTVGENGCFEHLAFAPFVPKLGVWHRVEIIVCHGWVGMHFEGRELLRCRVPFPEPNWKYPTSTQGSLGLTVNYGSAARVRVRNMTISFMRPTAEQIRELEAHVEE